MILRRVEITLIGPDEYPAEEGSYARWEADEDRAKRFFASSLRGLERTMEEFLPDGFEVEVSGRTE